MNINVTSWANGARRRRRFSAEQIQQFLVGFDQSGLSAAAFARQQGLCYEVLRRWLLRRRSFPGRGARPLRLQSVSLGSLLAPAWAAEITWINGPTVRLSAQASAVWTGQLLRTLRRAC